MKKLLFALLLFCLTGFVSAQQIVSRLELSSSGSYFIDYETPVDFYWLFPTGGGTISLTGNISVGNINFPPIGTQLQIAVRGGDFDLNGYTFTLQGQNISQYQLDAGFVYNLNAADASVLPPGYFFDTYTPNFFNDNVLSGEAIVEGSLPIGKIDSLGNGRLWIGNGSNQPVSRTISGDATLSNTGVLTFDTNAVTNNNIAYNAAIARTKIASGSASHVITNDGSGVLISEAQLNPSRGGLGTNASSSTGFVTFSAGSATIGALTDSKVVPVSFDSASELGDVKVLFPFACTLTGIYAEVTKTVQATDSCTITPKNNAGTVMGSGTLTLAAGTTIGTAFTSAPVTNNTFTAGQVLTLTVNKGTPGGKALLTLTYTRTN